MTTTEVLIGVACGIGVGIIAGIIIWVAYVQWNKRSRKKQKANRYRKTYDEAKQHLIIKSGTAPRFQIPFFPLAVQQPVVPFYEDPSTDRPVTPVPKDFRQGRRGSVPLDQLIAPSVPVKRKLSPASPPAEFAINQEAIKNFENRNRKRKFGAARSSTSPLGKLEFSLLYDQDFQNLEVHIIRGTQIYQPGSIEGLTELVISLAMVFDGEQIWNDSTKPTEASGNLDINEQLTIHSVTAAHMRLGTLKLTILKNNTNSPISVAYFALSNVPFNVRTTETVRLNEVEDIDEFGCHMTSPKDGPCNGELLVSMLHSPSDKKLTVGVECARDLPTGNKGPPDSYVKVDIVFIGHKVHSNKTKVFPKDCNPEYNEEFQFDIDDDKLPQIVVNLKIKSHGKMRDTRIGMVRLGYIADPHEPEYRHWQQVLHHPYLNIEKWHAIGK